jgi:hypothetical protein
MSYQARTIFLWLGSWTAAWRAGEAGSCSWGFIEPKESAIQSVDTECGGQSISRAWGVTRKN